MSLFISLNERGYNSLKEDRKTLKKKIKDLQKELDVLNGMLDEFNNGIDLLKDLYEPSIIKMYDYKKENKVCLVTFSIKHPIEKSFRISIRNLNEFKGLDDPLLKELAIKMAKDKLKKEFPIYFE